MICNSESYCIDSKHYFKDINRSSRQRGMSVKFYKAQAADSLARIIFMLITVYISLATANMHAQTSFDPDSALQVILEEIKGAPLTLKEAQQYALKNSTTVRTAEASYLAAQGVVRREAGFFDPEFFFSFNHLDQQQPSASFFAGASVLSTQQTSYKSGLRMNLPIGTELELSLNATRLKTNSQFAFLNPEYNTFGSLSFRQPLLDGFTASARKQLTSAEQTMEAMKARFDQTVLAVNSEIEFNYWDLYAVERDYAVQKLSHDQAEAFLKETELRAKAGLVGPNQVANAKTFLAEQKLLLLEREEQLDRQSDHIASLIGVRPEQGMLRFIPKDTPDNFNIEDVDVLVERALKNNLDLNALQKEIETANVLKNAASWEVLPRVDVVGSLAGSGLAGTGQDVVFGGDTLRTTRSGSFNDALNQVVKREFPSWSIGVDISIPIGFRKGLGEKDRLEAEAISAQQRYIEFSRSLEEQVRAAHRELLNGSRRLKAATEGVEAAQEQVRIGLIEFHNGRATAFELVRLGSDLASAQKRYSEALVRTAKSAALLIQLTSS